MKPQDPSNTPPPTSSDTRPSAPAPAASGAPAPASASAPGAEASRRSGRVQFDSRGQAVWEWAVRTGMFDRNASTQRIKALVETPLSLTEEPKPPAERDAGRAAPGTPGAKPVAATPSTLRPTSGNPYERAEPPAKLRPGESGGFDPYSRGTPRPRGR